MHPVTEAMDPSGQFYPRGIHGTGTERMEQDAQHNPEAPLSPPRDQGHQPSETEPHNIRELQLAAQLGQGLANTALLIPGASNEVSMVSGPDSTLRTILPHPPPDANKPEPHQTAESEQQDAADQVQQHYVSETHHQDQMSLALPMHLEHHHPHPAAYFPSGDTPPRKRSKVSRACDECRRKKVKCDAQMDVGNAVCSGCRRSNIPCLFSRVPQKRGPSKGYARIFLLRLGSLSS